MLIAQVRRTIEARALIPRGSRVLCACSGGPDSAALLFVLARLAPELAFELEAASVDHGLRAAAASEVAIAARQAAAVGVPFHALRVDVERRPSLQARARTARYEALSQLARARNAVRVAVGHTRDDQAETVLFRLIRGSGLHGLGAIEPARVDGVIRPLLDCDRAEVHRVAREQFVEIAVDPSNTDERFERVRIRTHLMPLLLAENPQIARHLSALADEAREYRAPLEWAAHTLLDAARADSSGRTLRMEVLAERPALLRRAALRAWLQEHGATPVSRAHLDEVDHAVRVRRGHVWLAQGFRAQASEDGCLRLLREGPGGKEQAGEP